MAQLCLLRVLLPVGAVGIVVCWIAIDETVKEEAVERESPIVGTSLVSVSLGPGRNKVVKGSRRVRVGVQIPRHLDFIVV